MIYVWRPDNFQDPTPLVHLRPKIFHPLDVGRPISNELPLTFSPLLQMMTSNQSIKKKHNAKITIIYYKSFLQVGFPFQYQLISLACNSLISFHLAEASLSAFSWLYTLYAFAQKYHEMSYIFNYIFSSHFAIVLFYLHNLKT